MEVQEAILARRSIRKFTDEPVSDRQLERLLQSDMAAPSACNKQPWEFYAVRSADKLEALRGTSRFTNMNSTLMIVVAGNRGRALSKRDNDFWIQDCSAAVENILLTAVDLGLGACWCGIYPVEPSVQRVRAILELPEEITPLALLQLGHPAETKESRSQYDPAFVHYL